MSPSGFLTIRLAGVMTVTEVSGRHRQGPRAAQVGLADDQGVEERCIGIAMPLLGVGTLRGRVRLRPRIEVGRQIGLDVVDRRRVVGVAHQAPPIGVSHSRTATPKARNVTSSCDGERLSSGTCANPSKMGSTEPSGLNFLTTSLRHS